MPNAHAPYTDWCGPELKQRVLACLYMNNGVIEHAAGNATRKLYDFMGGSHHHSFQTFRAGLRALEKQQLILREVRGGTWNKVIGPSAANKAGSRCYAIMMMNQDERPEEWAITEWEEHVRTRQLAALVGAKNEAKKANSRAAKAELQLEAKLLDKLPEVEPEPVNHLATTNGADPTVDVAVTLLAKVMEILNAPPVEKIKHVTRGRSEEEYAALSHQLGLVTDNLNVAVAAVADAEKELAKVKKENAELRSQVGKHRGQSSPLKQQLRDALSEDEWAKLMQQKPKDSA